MRVLITKGVGTQPRWVEVRPAGEKYVVEWIDGFPENVFHLDVDAFTDPAAALASCEAQRARKLASLRKQIAELEAVVFAVPEDGE
jgi:hypothetical protein